MTNKYDKRSLPFGNVFAIKDHEVVKLLESLRVENLFNETIQEEFLNKFKEWILSTTNNTVNGLEKYPYACFANGTTEAFDKFYGKHSKRRFRFFKGEYVYHRLSCRNYGYKWQYIEDGAIEENDVVIISLPFSNTGNRHEHMDTILDQCDLLNVPVLLDCVYFGVCKDIDFNLDRDCVKELTFGLSKSLLSAHLRIGMRLSKVDDDDPLFVTNKIGYTNRMSAHIGLELIKKFSPDYMYNKYRQRQLEYCNILGVEVSNCVMFGLGDSKWEEYNRDGDRNRLSLHKFLAEDCTNQIIEIANEKR
jgi:hypothetical protein